MFFSAINILKFKNTTIKTIKCKVIITLKILTSFKYNKKNIEKPIPIKLLNKKDITKAKSSNLKKIKGISILWNFGLQHI